MNVAVLQNLMSVQEYLAGEPLSDIRHEYLAGAVYAMAGAGEKHNRVAGNLFFHLRAATRGKPCGVFMNDMKVRVAQADSFYYPDVLVTCDPQDTEAYYKQFPCLIAEVLSPSIEAIDWREKLLAYRKLPSLTHYLLLSQEQRRVEWYARDDQGRWLLTVLEGSGVLDLLCQDLSVQVTLDDLYEDVGL